MLLVLLIAGFINEFLLYTIRENSNVTNGNLDILSLESKYGNLEHKDAAFRNLINYQNIELGNLRIIDYSERFIFLDESIIDRYVEYKTLQKDPLQFLEFGEFEKLTQSS